MNATKLSPLLPLLLLLFACRNPEEAADPVSTLSQAIGYPNSLRLSIQSDHRVMTLAPGDLGHPKHCCIARRVPLAECPPQFRREWDGTTLSPHGVYWKLGQRASSVGVRRIEGPYNCVDDSTSEWEFPNYLDGVPDIVNAEIAGIAFWDLNFNLPMRRTDYTFVWKEKDNVHGDDRFEWTVAVSDWVNNCLVASNRGRVGTYQVGSGWVANGRLCDNRGCSYGQYTVRYTVQCTVQDFSGGGGGSGGGAGGAGDPGGGSGGSSGGGGPPPCTRARPTAPPTAFGPSGCFASPLNPRFEWSSVPDADEYKLAVFRATEEPANDPLLFYEVIPGTSVTLPISLQPEARYRWKAKGQSCAGDGPFSELMHFTISSDCRPPSAAPQLIGPRGCVDQVRPVFSWNAVPGANWYRIVVSPADHDDFFIDQVITETSLVSPVALNPLTQYRFKVRAINDAGIGPWSEIVTFMPFCSGVASMITAPLGCIESQTPTFTWLPVSAAVSYWLLVANSNDFSNPATVRYIDILAPAGTTSYAPPPGVSFARGQTYFAKVKTLLDPTSTTAAAWSPTISFTPFCTTPAPP